MYRKDGSTIRRREIDIVIADKNVTAVTVPALNPLKNISFTTSTSLPGLWMSPSFGGVLLVREIAGLLLKVAVLLDQHGHSALDGF